MTIETFVAVRKIKGLSQVKYGETLGLSRGMIAYIETGRRNLGETTIGRVRELFGDDFVDQVRKLTECSK